MSDMRSGPQCPAAAQQTRLKGWSRISQLPITPVLAGLPALQTPPWSTMIQGQILISEAFSSYLQYVAVWIWMGLHSHALTRSDTEMCENRHQQLQSLLCLCLISTLKACGCRAKSTAFSSFSHYNPLVGSQQDVTHEQLLLYTYTVI